MHIFIHKKLLNKTLKEIIKKEEIINTVNLSQEKIPTSFKRFALSVINVYNITTNTFCYEVYVIYLVQVLRYLCFILVLKGQYFYVCCYLPFTHKKCEIIKEIASLNKSYEVRYKSFWYFSWKGFSFETVGQSLQYARTDSFLTETLLQICFTKGEEFRH